MKVTRKQKLRQRADKQARADAWKRESFSRILEALGVADILEPLPGYVHDRFIELFAPGLEVVAAQDSEHDPEVQALVRDIKRMVERPELVRYRDRVVELALDDLYRGYAIAVVGIRHWLNRMRGSHRPDQKRIFEAMAQAQAILDQQGEYALWELTSVLSYPMWLQTDRAYRVDGRLVTLKYVEALKPEGRPCERIVLRLHHAPPHVVPVDGSTRKAYPCWRGGGGGGVVHTTWKCKRLGIPSEKEELPVFVEKHALVRLHERLPFPCHDSMLHNILVDCMEAPVLTPRESGKYLVEVQISKRRVGYFVAQILPDLVLIRTFLFLTMQGTPEAACLREKLGMARADVERTKLDRFFTLVASDIAQDPLLARLLNECGCGHLLSWVQLDVRIKWLEHHAADIKERAGLREARGGFVIGQKWMRWSDSSATRDWQTGGVGKEA